jgi:tight adherence protein B
MGELLVLALVFAAVSASVWVLVPLLAEVGLGKLESRMEDREGSDDDAIYRFTTPQKLLQNSWSAGLLLGGLACAAMIAAGSTNVFAIFFVTALVGTASFQVPRLWLKSRIAKRRKAFEARLVDLTMGLSNGLRSGAALPQSLEMVTRDMGGVMGEEFGLLLREYRLGVDLPDGLGKLCQRMPSEDLRLLATAVRVTMQAGGSLAEVLDKISGTIRERIEFHEKLATMTAQGRFEAMAMALAPMVAFILLYIIDPELMSPMVTTTTGWTMLGVVAALELIGFFCINKIVTVEV